MSDGITEARRGVIDIERVPTWRIVVGRAGDDARVFTSRHPDPFAALWQLRQRGELEGLDLDHFTVTKEP